MLHVLSPLFPLKMVDRKVKPGLRTSRSSSTGAFSISRWHIAGVVAGYRSRGCTGFAPVSLQLNPVKLFCHHYRIEKKTSQGKFL